MTIRLTQAVLIAGADTPIGTKLSLNAALEADLVNGNKAVYVSGAPVGGAVAVTSQPDAVTGDIDYLVQPSGRASGFGQRAKKPRILKKFLDMANVTIAATTATVTPSIDQNSPFGGPALKLVITPSGSGARVDVTLSNLNIPAFDNNVAARVYIAAPYRHSSAAIWQSDAAFTNYSYWQTTQFSGGDVIGGERIIWGGPMAPTSVKADGGTGFVSGTDPLKQVRLRLSAINQTSPSFTVWVESIFIPAKQRPIVCFTFDDASSSWMTRLLPYLAETGIKATFNVYTAPVGSGAAYITDADIETLSGLGHQITSHNVNDYALQKLRSSGNGLSGGATAVESAAYATEYHTARQYLENLAVPAEDFCFHAWVQGGAETHAISLLRAAGVEIARTTDPYQVQPYCPRMGNNAMNLNAWPLGSTRSLVQNKAAVDQAVTYGGLLVLMGHVIADTSSDSITIAESEIAALLRYVATKDCDILTMRQLKDRFVDIGCIENEVVNPSPAVRQIGKLADANMNSTADQAITLPAGSWVITQIFATDCTVNLTASPAAGGIYTAPAKGGTAAVAAAQTYAALTGTATDVSTLTMAATPTVTLAAAGTGLYLSLTTGHGSAATADIIIFGRPA